MLKVSKEKCIGCGLCANLCPEIFEFGGDNKVKLKEGSDFEKNKECIKEAIQSCPMTAIEEE